MRGQLSMMRGSDLIRFFVDGRTIDMFGYVKTTSIPKGTEFDLDKLEESRDRIVKMFGKEAYTILHDISMLSNEKDIINDIIRDFKKTGWRTLKIEWL